MSPMDFPAHSCCNVSPHGQKICLQAIIVPIWGLVVQHCPSSWVAHCTVPLIESEVASILVFGNASISISISCTLAHYRSW